MIKYKTFSNDEIDEAKFLSLFTAAEGCWEWKGARVRQGYGRFPVSKHRELRAHRISYQLFYKEELKATDVVCHKCDNPPCVRLSHLFKSTTKGNLDDAVAKGRLVFSGRSSWERYPKGHEYAPNNIYWYKPNTPGKPKRRQCRQCTLDRQRKSGMSIIEGGDVGHAFS